MLNIILLVVMTVALLVSVGVVVSTATNEVTVATVASVRQPAPFTTTQVVRQPAATTNVVETFTAIEIAIDLYRDVENTESFTDLVSGMMAMGYTFDVLEVACANEMLTRGESPFTAICIKTGVEHTCALAPVVKIVVATGDVHTCALPVVEVESKEIAPRTFNLNDVAECRDWVLSLEEEYLAQAKVGRENSSSHICCFYHTKHTEAGYMYFYAINDGSNVSVHDVTIATFSDKMELVK